MTTDFSERGQSPHSFSRWAEVEVITIGMVFNQFLKVEETVVFPETNWRKARELAHYEAQNYLRTVLYAVLLSVP